MEDYNMDIRQESLQKHYEWNGKIEVVSRVKVNSGKDLSLAYTPGVAEPCLEINKDYNKSFELTRRNKVIAEQEKLFGDIIIEKAKNSMHNVAYLRYNV